MNKYKILAEAIASGKLQKVNVSTERVNYRRLTVDEIKQHLIEEFGKAKDVAAVKAKENAKGWGDAEIAKEIEWIKALDLCEFFDAKPKSKKEVNEEITPKLAAWIRSMTGGADIEQLPRLDKNTLIRLRHGLADYTFTRDATPENKEALRQLALRVDMLIQQKRNPKNNIT